DGLRDRLEDLRRGAELGGRDPESLRVTLSVTCCALPDADRARELVRQHLAFYVGGMGTFYRDALARQGHGETARRIHDAWQEGDRRAAVAALGDDLLDGLAAAGSPEAVAERLREFEGIEGVDAVAVSFPRGADRAAIDATVEALSP
ncbi:MAG: LLM class flavin-dependent oxidoreductase, partial [Haloferacaceae archaeon]